MNDKKQLDIELMRIFAAFFVIFNHTNNNGFFLFSQYEYGSLQFWVYLIPSIFCKFSVPLFFSIAGALLLNREPEPLPRLWIHRICRIGAVLLAWSFFYYMVGVVRGSETFRLKTFLATLYTSNWNFSFWYLYAYVAFLVTLPLLQRLAQGMSNRDFLYFLGVYILFSPFLQTVQYLLLQNRASLNDHLIPSWISERILFYPLLGYFLRYRIRDFWNRKRLTVLWMVNIACILLACWMTYREAVVTGKCTEEFHNTFVAINCIAVFVSCQHLFDKGNPDKRVQKLICSLGSSTLGVYLMHVLFLNRIPVISKLLDIMRLQWHINYMVSAFLYCGFIFVICYVVTLVMKKIPLLRQLI